MRYKKEYTVKEWKKFDKYAERENGIDITFQEILLKKYDVILTDYKTKKEKLFAVIDKFNAKNINAGITKFNKGMDAFSKTMGTPKKESRKRRNKKRKPAQKEPDYSFITGNRKTKFF